MTRLLGDDEDQGRLLLGGLGRVSIGQQVSAMRGGGLLKITRGRLRPAVSALAPEPRAPGSGGGGGGIRGGGQYNEK